MFPGRAANRQRIFKGHGQGLFHHDTEPVLSRRFDHLAVLADRGVDQQRLGVAGRDHRIHLGVEEAGIEMKLLGVTVGKRLVGIHNAHQLRFTLVGELLEEAGNMPVLEPHDGHS